MRTLPPHKRIALWAFLNVKWPQRIHMWLMRVIVNPYKADNKPTAPTAAWEKVFKEG